VRYVRQRTERLERDWHDPAEQRDGKQQDYCVRNPKNCPIACGHLHLLCLVPIFTPFDSRLALTPV
jgi:hypothetical protein